MSSNIGFVGLGRMGANMARRLRDCGFSIAAVYDVQHSIAESLAEELGATASLTLAGVTALSDVVITVVPDDAAMHAIFTGGNDSLLMNAQGRTFINCATVSPMVHLEVEAAAEKAGARALEGCMASSITQAREGSLFLIVGGKREVFEATKPILEKLSTNLRYVGGAGEAAKVKALVNMVMNINTAASALGLDLSMIREVFSQTGAASRVLVTDGEDMQNREHSCFFSAAHAAKDSAIALNLGEGRLHLPLAAVTKAQYERMVAIGLGELDKSGIAELTFPGRGPGK